MVALQHRPPRGPRRSIQRISLTTTDNTRPFKVLIKGLCQMIHKTGNGGSQHLSASFFICISSFTWYIKATRATGGAPGYKKKKRNHGWSHDSADGLWVKPTGDAYLPAILSETESEKRPLARRRASTLRPLLVAILSRKPCLLIRRLLEGWNVLFIVSSCSKLLVISYSSCRGRTCSR